MQSIWTETVIMPQFDALDHDERTDVLVIGGGLAGITCAYRLQQAGVSVIVVEADRIGHGTTAGTTAKVTTQHGGTCYQTLIDRYGETTARRYRECQQDTLTQWDELVKDIECDWQTVDAFVYSLTDAISVKREEEALHRLGAAAESVDVPLPFDAARMLRIPDQRQCHPLKLLAGLASSLTIYEHTRIRELREQIAVTDRGQTIFAQHIIVASHFPFINRYGLYPLKLYQQRSYALAVESDTVLHGMLIDTAADGLFWRSYDKEIILSGAGHRTGKAGEAWKPLETAVERWLPEGRITHRWAAQDCCTADTLPYVGAYSPRTPSWQVITGFCEWGMMSSLLAADLTVQAVTEHTTDAAMLYAPSRTVPYKPLLYNACESVMGLVTPSVPRCSHLGCALHWNPWEHSWDCACHGSRFSERGDLLIGPAMDNIHTRKTGDR